MAHWPQRTPSPIPAIGTSQEVKTVSPQAWKILRSKTYAPCPPQASVGANCDYLTDCLLGYRETIIDPDSNSPFSPGSTMDGA